MNTLNLLKNNLYITDKGIVNELKKKYKTYDSLCETFKGTNYFNVITLDINLQNYFFKFIGKIISDYQFKIESENDDIFFIYQVKYINENSMPIEKINLKKYYGEINETK